MQSLGIQPRSPMQVQQSHRNVREPLEEPRALSQHERQITSLTGSRREAGAEQMEDTDVIKDGDAKHKRRPQENGKTEVNHRIRAAED